MNDARSANVRGELRPAFAGRGAGSLLEIDAWMPNEISAISPLVERLMRLVEGSHCITGEEHAVQLALREALNNAIVAILGFLCISSPDGFTGTKYRH